MGPVDCKLTIGKLECYVTIPHLGCCQKRAGNIEITVLALPEKHLQYINMLWLTSHCDL